MEAWYTGHDPSTIIQDAYNQAKDYFEKELSRNAPEKTWIHQLHSIDEVLAVASNATSLYSASKDPRTKTARQWSLAFSQRIMLYGKVLDMLAQHHPEYVSLAWGAVKFVLQGALNHAEIITEFTKALSEIADALPRVSLRAELYPTSYMKEMIARIYANIMLFLQKAVRWFGMGSVRRTLSSIGNPWTLSYKETVDQIRFLTNTMDAMGNAVAGAELRDMSTAMKAHDAKLDVLQSQLDKALAVINNVLTVATSTDLVAHSMSTVLDDHSARLCDLQFMQILSVLKPTRLPEDVLHSCRSMAKRHTPWSQSIPDSTKCLQQLNRWSSIPGSALFVVCAGLRAETITKHLALEVVSFIQASSLNVIWFFTERLTNDEEMGLHKILKALIYQVLASNPDILKNNPDLINASKFQALSKNELQDLLIFLLLRLSNYFIIVETEALYRQADDKKDWCRDIENLFQTIIDKLHANSGTVKILLVSYGSANTTQSLQSDRVITYPVHVQIVPLSKKRKFLPRNNDSFARGLKKTRLRPIQ